MIWTLVCELVASLQSQSVHEINTYIIPLKVCLVVITWDGNGKTSWRIVCACSLVLLVDLSNPRYLLKPFCVYKTNPDTDNLWRGGGRRKSLFSDYISCRWNWKYRLLDISRRIDGSLNNSHHLVLQHTILQVS